MADDRLRFPRGPMLALAAAAAMTIDVRRPENPRFADMPFSIRSTPKYKGRSWRKRNPNASKQAAAKRARKITRRRS